jgi:hypothetical protein
MTASFKSSFSRACLAFGLAFSLGASMPISVAPDTDTDADFLKVTNLEQGHVLWVRSSPSVRAQRIGFFRYNDRYIRSYGCKMFRVTWCEVQYQGTRGWASKLYLTEDSAREAEANPATRLALNP